MTKEKVIEHLANIGGFDTSYSYGNMKSCIEQVFDYFENKSCENCIHKSNKENYDLECSWCSRFYSDRFEEQK